jgi:hypothetical protein
MIAVIVVVVARKFALDGLLITGRIKANFVNQHRSRAGTVPRALHWSKCARVVLAVLDDD